LGPSTGLIGEPYFLLTRAEIAWLDADGETLPEVEEETIFLGPSQ